MYKKSGLTRATPLTAKNTKVSVIPARRNPVSFQDLTRRSKFNRMGIIVLTKEKAKPLDPGKPG